MIHQMKEYNYYTLTVDEYGQQVTGDVAGTIKMSIALINQNRASNMLYNDATFTGFTYDTVSDNFVIQFGSNKLKVFYVQQHRGVNIAYMGLIKC